MKTELGKRIAGELYNPLDPEIGSARRRARHLNSGPDHPSPMP
jgi:hypothetical protein